MIKMVFWLVIGGTSQTGVAIHDVPFQTKEACEVAAALVTSDSRPYVSGTCFTQAASDLTDLTRALSGTL